MKHEIVRRIKLSAYGPRNLILRATGESLKPKWLWFEVNDRCNNRCIFCNIWRKKPAKDPLELKEIERMLSDPLFEEVEYILNSGGEPTVRDDLEEIFLIEHKVLPKATLQLGTNGSLPERVIDVVKSAIKHDINIDVGVSLDGIGENRDLIRGVKGSFEKVDRLLHELVAMREKHRDKLRLSVGFVLIDLTLPSLDEAKAYAQKLNVDLNAQWYSHSPYYNTGKNLATNKEALFEVVRSLPPSFVREMKLKALRGKSIKFPCFAMHTFCLLQCNGDIVPCFEFWDTKVGNVRETPPSLVWHSSEAKKARKMVKECQGCLNDCGVMWSLGSFPWMALPFYIKRMLGVVK